MSLTTCNNPGARSRLELCTSVTAPTLAGRNDNCRNLGAYKLCTITTWSLTCEKTPLRHLFRSA